MLAFSRVWRVWCGVFAPNVSNFSRVWRGLLGSVLQTRGEFPAFVVTSAILWNICRNFTSRLEGCGWFGAPNVGSLSRVWRVWCGVLLQMWGIHLVFGGLWLVWRSKCGEFFSCLEGLRLCRAPNAGKFSGVCCRFAVVREYKTWRILTLGLRL